MKKVTLKDVAKDAGVSTSIASFAINNVKGRVSPEVRERVLQSADKLGYVPNLYAKNLKSNHSDTIALYYLDHFIKKRYTERNEFLLGAIDYSSDLNQDILIKTCNMEMLNEKMIDECMQLYLSGKVRGVLFGFITPEPPLIEMLQSKNINFVVVPNINKVKGVNTIFLDNYKWVKESVKYVVGKGYEKLYYYTILYEDIEKNERVNGFLAAASELNIEAEVIFCHDRSRKRKTYWQTIKDKIQNLDKKTAILCWNDEDALNILDTLLVKGIKVPEQIGIFGFDNSSASEESIPPLSTVNHPFRQMARSAIDLVIANSECTGKIPITSTEVKGEIIERESI